jgi:hypothetical protein
MIQFIDVAREREKHSKSLTQQEQPCVRKHDRAKMNNNQDKNTGERQEPNGKSVARKIGWISQQEKPRGDGNGEGMV